MKSFFINTTVHIGGTYGRLRSESIHFSHRNMPRDSVDVCRKVRESGMKVGLALKPGTDVTAVEQYVDHADMVLIMTVKPGFGGQKFMTDMMNKVRWLRQQYPELDIEVDGVVGPAIYSLFIPTNKSLV